MLGCFPTQSLKDAPSWTKAIASLHVLHARLQVRGRTFIQPELVLICFICWIQEQPSAVSVSATRPLSARAHRAGHLGDRGPYMLVLHAAVLSIRADAATARNILVDCTGMTAPAIRAWRDLVWETALLLELCEAFLHIIVTLLDLAQEFLLSFDKFTHGSTEPVRHGAKILLKLLLVGRIIPFGIHGFVECRL